MPGMDRSWLRYRKSTVVECIINIRVLCTQRNIEEALGNRAGSMVMFEVYWDTEQLKVDNMHLGH